MGLINKKQCGVRSMRKMIGCAALAASLFAAPAGMAQEWANLEVTFVYDGDKIPARKELDMSKDPVCAKTKQMDELLVVNATNKGIKNVGFWVDKTKSKLTEADIHPSMKDVPTSKLLLDNKDCVFTPHFLIARSGQTIEVKNSDSTGHNANFNFINNQGVNFVVAANSSQDLTLGKGIVEPAPIPVQCNVHPWMEAKLMVIDHPYGAVSDENGVLKMEKLPAGKALTFKLFHENQNKLEEVEVDGKKQEWKKGFGEMTLKAGDNKMTIKISSSKFKNK